MSKRTQDGQKKVSTNLFKVPSQIRTRSSRKNSVRCLRTSVSKTTDPPVSLSGSKVKKSVPIKPSLPPVKTRRKATIPRKNAVHSQIKVEPTHKNEKSLVGSQLRPNKPARTSLKQRCLTSSNGNFAEFFHTREHNEELTDDDLLEIVHCPSPVWWEDPPNESYDEDPICSQVKDAANTEKNTGVKQPSPTTEITVLKIPRIPDSKCDRKFVKKRSTLENILKNVLSKKDATNSVISADGSSKAQSLRMVRKAKNSNTQSVYASNQTTGDLESKCDTNESNIKTNSENSSYVKTTEVKILNICGNRKIDPSTSLAHVNGRKKLVAVSNYEMVNIPVNDNPIKFKKTILSKPLQISPIPIEVSQTDKKNNSQVKRVYCGSDSAEIIPNDVNSVYLNSIETAEQTANDIIDLCNQSESDKNVVSDDSQIFETKEYEILKDFQSLKIPVAEDDELIVIEDGETDYENFPDQLQCPLLTDNLICTENEHPAKQENMYKTQTEMSNNVSDKMPKADLMDHHHTMGILLKEIEDTKSNLTCSKKTELARKSLKRKHSDSFQKHETEDNKEHTENIIEISEKHCNKNKDQIEKDKIRSAYNDMLTKIRSRIRSRKDTCMRKDSPKKKNIRNDIFRNGSLSLNPHKQLKYISKSLKTSTKPRTIEKSNDLSTTYTKSGKSIIKVLPIEMSREMIDNIIGIKNTKVHANPESLEEILCPDLSVKNDIIIEHKDNVKYCFSCSSIYNTKQCSYCNDPKHTSEDSLSVQKLYSCNFCEYKSSDKSKIDIHTTDHEHQNLHNL